MADIAPHWTHERLAENLRAASHAQTIEAAAIEWMLRDTGDIRNVRDARARQEIRCQLCNHEILRYAVLENTVNRVLLIIGLDCLRKLVAFLESGRIKAPLRSGTGNRQRLNELLDALQAGLAGGDDLRAALTNKTVLGWFAQELDVERLPEGIARLMRLVELDVLPNAADAERLVEHYKQHRLLPIEVLVPAHRLRLLARFRRLLPAMIPIAAIPRVLALADHAERIADTHRKHRELAARRQWLDVQLAHFRHRGLLSTQIPDGAIERVSRLVERDRSLTARLRLPAALVELDRLLERLRNEIPGSDWYLQKDVERLRADIAAAAEQPSSYTHVDLLRRVMEWDRVVRRQLDSPTVRVYVNPSTALPTVFSLEADGSWEHRRWFIREEQRPGLAGVYAARLVSDRDLFAFTVATGPEPRPATFALDVPLDHSPFGGRYRGQCGRDGDRWVIPVPSPVWRAGTYRCLVLREATDHLLVYPLARVRARRKVKP